MKDRPSQRYARVMITMLMLLTMCAFHGLARAQSRPADSRAPSPFDGIKKTYSEIVTLEARFQQRIFIASLKKERDSEGEFFYKRHKGFLWKYKAPKVRYFLYDGRYIWQGDEEKPFVIKERIRKEKTGGTFLDLIDDIAKLDEQFSLTRSSRSGDLEVLELAPKKEGTVTAARVFIDLQNLVRKIEIDEFTGNTNAIEFSSIKINRETDDGRFVFRPDKEKEIIER